MPVLYSCETGLYNTILYFGIKENSDKKRNKQTNYHSAQRLTSTNSHVLQEKEQNNLLNTKQLLVIHRGRLSTIQAVLFMKLRIKAIMIK